MLAVGDLHGNVHGLIENLRSLNVVDVNADQQLHWTGGARQLVFHGDILGDRNMGGFEILTRIAALRKEASAAGGSIEVIAGNHDDFLISFLAGRPGAGNADNLKTCENGGYFGLLELAQFGSPELQSLLKQSYDETIGKEKLVETWRQLSTEREAILTAMRQDPRGRQLLEAMCSMKLVTKRDDTLFLHTNPTEQIMELLLQHPDRPLDDMVRSVNQYYQQGLRALLIDGEAPNQYYQVVQDTFLNTSNRNNFKDSSTIGARLRSQGMNAIFHGHSDDPVRSRSDQVLIVSTDQSSFKYQDDSKARSVAAIARNGQVALGADHKIVRG